MKHGPRYFRPRGVQLVHTVEANNRPLQLVIHVVQRPY